jgi:hypothetical protein
MSSSRRSESLIVVPIVALAFIFFLILTARTILGIIISNLSGRDISGGKRGKRIIIKRRHGRRKFVELIDGHLLVLSPLVSQEYVLALTGVTTPSKHTLKNPKDTAERGRRAVQRRRRS